MRDALFDAFVVATTFVLRSPGHRPRVEFVRRVCGWTVGEGTVIERGLRISTRGGVEIGRSRPTDAQQRLPRHRRFLH